MSEELNKLASGFKAQEEIHPRESAKASALASAMAAFEKEKSTSAQGIETEARLTNQTQEKKPLFDWRNKMEHINSKFTYGLMGGVSLAALAFVMINGGLLNEFMERGGIAPVNIETTEKRIEAEVDSALSDETSTQITPSELQEVIAPQVKPQSKPLQQAKRAAEYQASPPASQQQGLNNVLAPSSTVIGAPEAFIPTIEGLSRDQFEQVDDNPVKQVKTEPVSTFSVDVDTASYSFMRSSINNNALPPADSIRVEELINYFDYSYAAPADKSEPFKASVELMPTPWNDNTKLMSIGITGYELQDDVRPSSNLVFLIDTSGSMQDQDKLPLLRNAFKLLLSSLKPDDTISIVTYAGSAGTALEPTKVKDKSKILEALNNLHAGGSTAGAAGLRQAYALAEENKLEDGTNRVILATDGDFNVGMSSPEEMETYIAKKRKSGVSLSVLGFGRGNYNDHLMQKLAQNGNGNAAYIDTLSEARKVLVEEAGSTLFTIAKDVKLQVEFNPNLVSEYRLIGYETRALKQEDFNNDKVDAGDIGAGHQVTALYEITPVGAKSQSIDPLRYEQADAAEEEKKKSVSTEYQNEYGFLKIRYKLPDSDTSTLITTPITSDLEVDSINQASENLRFSSAVAGYGQLLKGSKYLNDFSYDDVINQAQGAKGKDEFGYRSEFLNLVRMADSLDKIAE